MRKFIWILILSLNVVGCSNATNEKTQLSSLGNIVYFHGEKFSYIYAPGSGYPTSEYVDAKNIGKSLGQLDNTDNGQNKEVYEITGVDPKQNIALKVINEKGETAYIKLTHEN